MAVAGHEPHAFDDRLSDHQPVERIAVDGRQALHEGSMGGRDVEQGKTGGFKLGDGLIARKRRRIRPAAPYSLSSGSVPVGLPSRESRIFSTLSSAAFSSVSQCAFNASPRS